MQRKGSLSLLPVSFQSTPPSFRCTAVSLISRYITGRTGGRTDFQHTPKKGRSRRMEERRLWNGVGEQQPFPRRTVTGSLSCQTSSPPSIPPSHRANAPDPTHDARTPPTTVLSPTWSNFTTSEGSCGQRRKRAADIIVGSTLIIPFLPPAWGCSSHSRGCSLPNCLQCDCLSKVVEGIKTSPYPRERIRVKEKEGGTKRERGEGSRNPREKLPRRCGETARSLLASQQK